MDLFKEIKTRKAKQAEKENEHDPFDKKLTPFDFILQIIDKTKKYPYESKYCPGFLISLWFSHSTNSKIIDIVQEMNCLQFSLKDDIIYRYYFDQITKRMEVPRWIKKVKIKEDKDLEDNLEKIKSNYRVSRQEALQIKNHKERISKI